MARKVFAPFILLILRLAGATWTHVGLDATRMIAHLVIHSENPDSVYIAAMGRLRGRNEKRGLYKIKAGDLTDEGFVVAREAAPRTTSVR